MCRHLLEIQPDQNLPSNSLASLEDRPGNVVRRAADRAFADDDGFLLSLIFRNRSRLRMGLGSPGSVITAPAE
jgi:hypothetical protein